MLPTLVALLVTLDPGHSPLTRGALSARGRGEVEFNVEMVQRVSRELAAATKVKVRRTRADWESATLRRRAERAAGASLLLSVHHDSPHPDDFDLWWDGEVARLHSAAGRGFSLHVRGDRPDSVRVAKAIAKALVEAGFTPSRYHVDYLPVVDESLGIYDRRHLGLLNWARVPAVILECGFVSHLEEEVELGQSDRQDRMARAIAAGVLEGLGRKP
ncbi:MAG TPA: N-acetylmuramoyl-L-alanine amidase [Myxococcales bacterium]|jgi:N-acetylmuramoyl-L-alanine amidase